MNARIEDYAVLGDLHTAALVNREGAVDWLCLPRFDSGACFAALLGSEENGRWLLAPAQGGGCTRRSYRGHSLVLESEWETNSGTVRLIDFMPPRRGEAPDLIRIVEGVSGRVAMQMDLRLRLDYGHIVPWVQRHGDDLHAVGGPDALWLRTPVPVRGRGMSTVAEFEVSAGDRLPFVLTHHPSHLPRPEPVDPEQALRETSSFWSQWLTQCDYEGEWGDAVRSSLVLLKALTYAPTGGIVAAATTSLPEQLGGPRNWDYRYCWLRDATFTLQALLGTGFVEEARAWREWLLRAIAGDPADLQTMYTLDGARRMTEAELPWLAGYEGSTPVRVGNAAADQLQLDVWGEVLDGLHVARSAGLAPTESAWAVQRALLEFLADHWSQPDNGLWEMRGPRRHFVHSKAMAWAGGDRGVQAAEQFGLPGPVDSWRELRDRIHRDVCEQGYDAERGTFTQSYGSQGLDAALLLIPRVGFLPWDDERVVGTVRAVRRELMQDGLLLRYRPEGSADGLPGGEAAFLACTFWLVDALTSVGEHGEARELFERLLALRNDLGILSEEYDVRAGRALGNVPQAFSHVGLVNAARHLSGTRPASRGEQGRTRGG